MNQWLWILKSIFQSNGLKKIKVECVKTNQNSFSNSSWKTKFFNLIITSLQNDFKIRSIQTFYFKENQSNN